MAVTNDKTDSDNTCAEFVHSNVSMIASLLERLVFLASLRKPDTDEYYDCARDRLLALKSGKAEARAFQRGEQSIGLRCTDAELDNALRQEHLAVFEAWLCLNMRQQMAELERYASSQDIPPDTLSRQWVDGKSYEGLIPSSAIPVQCQLFRTDMKTGLAALVMRRFWGY